MNEQLILFEDKEVKVKTDKGETLINLVHTAKCCGLIQTKGSSTVVRWKSGNSSVIVKLNNILGSPNVPPQYIEEIKYVLDEIDNTDDRTQIYMSSWLSKRLAMECKSDLAMKYKNFLATLDEKRENGQLMASSQEVANLVSNTVQNIIPTLVGEITKQFAPMLVETKNQVNTMAGLMHDQSVIYDQEREELKSMIGMRSRNTKDLTDKLKYELEKKYDEKITAKDNYYINAKNKLFEKYRVLRWEQIPVAKYNDVFASIEEMFYE